MAQNRAETCYLKTNINFVLYVTDLENTYWKQQSFQYKISVGKIELGQYKVN